MPTLTVTSLDLAILITYVLGSRLIFGWPSVIILIVFYTCLGS